jgi:cob(I)alamin adenosyltransferase
MTRFYTQTGDDGYTGLLGEGRTPKYDPRLETIGAIDEANAILGLARSISLAPQTAPILLTVQRDLYRMMAEIAILPGTDARFECFSSDRVSWLEHQIQNLSESVTVPNEFIVPGDSHSGASLDLARTITRRAERHIANAHQRLIDNPELLRYANRLSSLCFVLEILKQVFRRIEYIGQETPEIKQTKELYSLEALFCN